MIRFLLTLITLFIGLLVTTAALESKSHYVEGTTQAGIGDSTMKPGNLAPVSEYWMDLAFGADSLNRAFGGTSPLDWINACVTGLPTPSCWWLNGIGMNDALWIELGHNAEQDPVIFKDRIENLIDLAVAQAGLTHFHLVIPPYTWDAFGIDKSAQRAWQDMVAEVLNEICDADPWVECTVDLRGATTGWGGHFRLTNWVPPEPNDGVHHGPAGMIQVADVIIVPEPAQWLVLGSGIMFLMGIRRFNSPERRLRREMGRAVKEVHRNIDELVQEIARQEKGEV